MYLTSYLSFREVKPFTRKADLKCRLLEVQVAKAYGPSFVSLPLCSHRRFRRMVAARLLGRALSVGGTATSAAVLAWASSGPSTSQLSKNAAAPTQSTMPVGQPGVELLVHNISHSDMVVALQEVAHGSDGLPLGAQGDVLARPVFNSFMPVSMAIMERLEQILASGGQPTVLKCLSQYRVEYPTGLDLTGGMDEGLVITRSGHEHNHDSRQPDFGSCTSLSETNISDPWKLFNIKGLKESVTGASL